MSRRNKNQIKKLSEEAEKKQNKPAKKAEKKTIEIELTPEQLEQLDRLRKLDHNSTRDLYCKKVISHHIANRWHN